MIVSAPTLEGNFNSRITNCVRASLTNLVSFEKMKARGNIPCTKVTYWAQVDLGGFIPKHFANNRTVSFLSHLSQMRKRFSKSLEVDARERNDFILKMEQVQTYDSKEILQIDNGLQKLEIFKHLPNRKTVKSVSPLVSCEVATEKNDRNAFGRSSAIVRASPEQVLAYQW